MDLSIIVPVYNVERYIRPCIESIFRQGLKDSVFEVIIVNDGSTDKSMEMIQDIILQHSNITIINQENQGLSVARNNGIAKAKGDYILMPDSDDLLIENSLKPLLDNAIKSQADLIVADFLKLSDEEINKNLSFTQKEFTIKEKNGRQLFLEDLNPRECFVWRTLYRKNFLIKENLKFYPNIRYQDIPFTHECYIKAGKCLRIFKLLNIYRKWPGASTLTFNNTKARDFSIAIAKTWELTYLSGLSPSIVHKLQEDVWTSFIEMLRLLCHHVKNSRDRYDIIYFLQKQVPELTFQNGKKQRLISYLYKNMPHIFITYFYLYITIIEDHLLPFYYHNIRTLSYKK